MNVYPPPRAHRRGVGLLAVLVFALVPLLGARPARAAVTFTVNQTGDAGDLDLGDGVCDSGGAAGEQCTLRAALQQANTGAERDTIAFAIAGPGVKSVRPAAELPAITQPLLIDGYTQPGAARNTLATGTNAVLRIELDGSNAGNGASGLQIEAPNTVIRGLVLNRFDNDGLRLNDQAAGSRIEGCFIGTNAAGTVARGNGDGMTIDGPNVVVGGTARAARNLIAANVGSGIDFNSASTNSRVEGNLIGTDKTGAGALGNGATGVVVIGRDNTIGGNSEAAANTIAFNNIDGVVVAGTFTVRNRILRNAIFANGEEGIDLSGGTENATGATANDPGDPDTGPNTLQNKPVLTAATTTGGTTTIAGQLNSTPNRAFVLRFFSNPTGGEGKVFRGQLNVVTGAGGNAAFTFTAISPVPVGHAATATATSEEGDTSEFSTPRVVG